MRVRIGLFADPGETFLRLIFNQSRQNTESLPAPKAMWKKERHKEVNIDEDETSVERIDEKLLYEAKTTIIHQFHTGESYCVKTGL